MYIKTYSHIISFVLAPIPPTSMSSSAPNTSSAFSRTSPNVHFTHPSHRSGSPSQPANLTRGSPLHLSHHPATSSSSSASIPSSTAQNTGTYRVLNHFYRFKQTNILCYIVSLHTFFRYFQTAVVTYDTTAALFIVAIII